MDFWGGCYSVYHTQSSDFPPLYQKYFPRRHRRPPISSFLRVCPFGLTFRQHRTQPLHFFTGGQLRRAHIHQFLCFFTSCSFSSSFADGSVFNHKCSKSLLHRARLCFLGVTILLEAAPPFGSTIKKEAHRDVLVSTAICTMVPPKLTFPSQASLL